MLSVKLEGDNLSVKVETLLGNGDYRKFIETMESIPGAVNDRENYRWLIHKQHVDLLDQMFPEKIAWFTSIEDIKGIVEVTIPKFTVTTEGLEDFKLAPYPFQYVGISFLHDIVTGLLADEMGLGKTPQSMGATHRLWKEGKARKALVVCPSSLKYQWADEIKNFTDHESIVIDGTPAQREAQYRAWINSDILFAIVNYELVRNDIDIIEKLKFDVVQVDEIHRMKNPASQISKSMKRIRARYRFGMTGTPIQNNPEELWNIMDFLNPEILGSWNAFRKRYVVTGEKFGKRGVIIGYKNLGELRRRIGQYMLRRMKKEVAPDLPEMTFNNYILPMTSDQVKLHEKVSEDFLELLEKIGQWNMEHPAAQNTDGDWVQEPHPKQGQMLGFFTMMLEICDSPQLLAMSDAGMTKAYRYIVDDVASARSPKLDEIESIAKEQLEMGNTKIVIFTQFARMQELVVERLRKYGGVQMLNGSMKPFERQASVDQFRYNPDANFFVTTDAGNYGINLQFANVLVHMDLPWNPAIYDQRCGRIHRIGSAFKEVTIINLIARDGIDERIQETLYKKRELAGQIVEKNEQEKAAMQSMTSGLLQKLVKPKKGKKIA